MVSITIVISFRLLDNYTMFQWDWICSFSVFSSESPWERVWYLFCFWSRRSDCHAVRPSSSTVEQYANSPRHHWGSAAKLTSVRLQKHCAI